MVFVTIVDALLESLRMIAGRGFVRAKHVLVSVLILSLCIAIGLNDLRLSIKYGQSQYLAAIRSALWISDLTLLWLVLIDVRGASKPQTVHASDIASVVRGVFLLTAAFVLQFMGSENFFGSFRGDPRLPPIPYVWKFDLYFMVGCSSAIALLAVWFLRVSLAPVSPRHWLSYFNTCIWLGIPLAMMFG